MKPASSRTHVILSQHLLSFFCGQMQVHTTCCVQVNAVAVSPSIQTQFDMALSFLRHQLEPQPPAMTSLSPLMTSPAPRVGGDDVTRRSATESLLLAALGLAAPAAGAGGGGDGHLSRPGGPEGDWSPTGLTMDARRYKTELCRAYEERGLCRYGDRCQFAHGVAELRALQRHPKYKTELCRTYHTAGFCPYGARCHFVHNGAGGGTTAPPPTPRDVERRHSDVHVAFQTANSSSSTCAAVADSIQLSLLSAALDQHAASITNSANTRAPVTTTAIHCYD